MTEESEMISARAFDDASNKITVPITKGQLFGPFSDPLQWMSSKYGDVSVNHSHASALIELFANVDIARHSDEQNMEIIHRNSHFYFRAIQNIDNTNTLEKSVKLLAWFSDELNAKLPEPSSSTINGSRRYYCALCNQIFMHPNPVVIHILYKCPKRMQFESNMYPSLGTSAPSSAVSQLQVPVPAKTTKKRGFDIASLVNEESDDNSRNKRLRNGVESNINDSGVNCWSAFHHPKYIPQTRNTSSTTSIHSTNISSHSCSAFKKVDQKNNESVSPYDLSSLYHRVATSALMPLTEHSAHLMQSLSMPTCVATPLSTTTGKSLVSSTLLSYLPPSLAALTFPTSNWCAKCNATFRMTSDLVYHMRSHHMDQKVEHIKKKREEKLKCNICHETFRERHHLTRHMTSHQ